MQDFKIIKLVNGGEVFVDESDYEWASQFRWFRSSAGYAHRQGWTNGKHWTVWLHRELNRTPPNLFTDHINGNKSDNRRSNLRTVNKAQNSTNRPKIRLKMVSSKLKGVSYHPYSKLWRARTQSDGKERTTYHKTEQEAAAAYNQMARERFGEFAQLNHI